MGWAMQRFDRKLIFVAVLAAMAPAVAACSSDFSLGELNPVRKLSAIGTEALTFSSAPPREQYLRPVTADDLVNPEGQCAAALPNPAGTEGEGATPALLQGGIALQMTECDVIRRAGTPDRVEIGANERREREVVMTYSRGRPGIYRFAEGRLYSIERGAEPAPAPKQQRPAKSAKKSGPA